MTVVWRHGALASARRFIADQAGMRAINQAVAGLADRPVPPDAFVRGSYRRLRVGNYRVHGALRQPSRRCARRLG